MNDKPTCCNDDCCQGRDCPLGGASPWWAEVVVVVAYLLVAIATVALVIYGGAKLASYMLTLYPISK